MRYVRMLTNAVAGGLLAVLYLTVLVLQLNPLIPVISPTALRWFGALLAFYGPYVGVALYFLILGVDLVAPRPLRPAWLSVRLLAWLCAVGAAGAAWLMWANLTAFRSLLTPAAAERMRDGAVATTVFAAVLVLIAVLRYSFGRRGSRATGVLLVGSMVFSVAMPLWFRGPGDVPFRAPHRWIAPPRLDYAPRVRVLVLDGASLGFIRGRVAAGQLPNFGRLLDRGAVSDLATLRPTQAEPVWVAAATGKAPQKNGVRSKGVYRVSAADSDSVDVLPDYCFAYGLVNQGFIHAADRTATSVDARPVWDILADYGVTSGVVGWPLTYPAHATRGFIVTDRVDEAASSPLRLADAEAGDPTTAVDVAREVFDVWQVKPWRDLLPAFADGETPPAGVNFARWDRAYSETANTLEQQFAPRLIAVRYEGLAPFGHNFLRDAQPELFGDPRRADPRRSMLDRYYEYIDSELGLAIQRLAPGDLVLVVSGFGMEPTPLTKRLLARLLGWPELTGTHESAPDGFLMAYGTNVANGEFPRGAVVDLAPTILYYMGAPVGSDMDGAARTDFFLTTYAIDHPVKYVASHEK